MKSIESVIDDPGTCVICSHSGGKDSQAMYAFLKNVVPKDRLFVVHAHLRGAEWKGTIAHIQANIDSPFVVVEARKSFMEMVDHRQMWPSPSYRQCTSDLKRGPIRKAIRQIMTENPQFHTVLDCMGLRAEESPARAKKAQFSMPPSLQTNKRSWYQWLPIHDWPLDVVLTTIRNTGQKLHWAYDLGMSRLSCMFCIMMSDRDLYISRQANPDKFQEYVNKELETGQTFFMPRNGVAMTLEEIIQSFIDKTPKEELDEIDDIILNNL